MTPSRPAPCSTTMLYFAAIAGSVNVSMDSYYTHLWNGIKFVREEISKERYEEVIKAKDVCLLAIELEEKMSLLIDNYFEFEEDLLSLGQQSAMWGNRDHTQAMTDRLLIDRRIVNVLTACRLYLDQSDHGISGLFGNPSEQLTAIKLFKNQLYDAHLGYRVMEAIRNHVQHAGLPVHKISYSHQVNSTEPPRIESLIEPSSMLIRFGQDKTFKSAILKELKKLGAEVDLRRPLREYISCLLKLHTEITATIADKFKEARSTYLLAHDWVAGVENKGHHVSFAIADAETGVVKEESYVGGEILELYDEVHRKNSMIKEVGRYFASNRIVENGVTNEATA